MNKFLLISGLLCTTILSSCGFLLSPVGEELIVDGAEEVIKVEEELTNKTPPKTPVKDHKKEPAKQSVKGIYKEAK